MKRTILAIAAILTFAASSGCVNGPYYYHRPWGLAPCTPGNACGDCDDCGIYYDGGEACGPTGCGPAGCGVFDSCGPACGGACGTGCEPCGAPTTCGPDCAGCNVCCPQGPISWVISLFTRGVYWGSACGPAYCGDWCDSPPTCCDPCNAQGKYIGGGGGGRAVTPGPVETSANSGCTECGSAPVMRSRSSGVVAASAMQPREGETMFISDEVSSKTIESTPRGVVQTGRAIPLQPVNK